MGGTWSTHGRHDKCIQNFGQETLKGQLGDQNIDEINKIRGATGSDEPWLAEQPPMAVFPDCTRQYWVDMWSAHRVPQLHFQLSKPDRYFFIQVTTQFIRSRG
jgi:hypothetical protein